MKVTKDIKDELRAEYYKSYGYDDEVVEYYVKGVSGVWRTRGRIVTFEKPHIQTEFWFGESGHDYEEVLDRCRRLSEDERYFVEENLRNSPAGWQLRQIGNGCLPNVPLLRENDGNSLAKVIWEPWDSVEPDDPSRLTEQEVRELELALEDEQARFLKRLEAYLKRYGLSKCRFSTYWRDR